MFSRTSRFYGSLSSSFSKGFATAVHSPIAIIGSGCAGIAVSAQLLRNGVLPQHIRIFDPSKFHHYQPGWTMVGGGITTPDKVISDNYKMIPSKIPWTQQAVTTIDPDNRYVVTEDGSKYSYDQLVIASGIQNNYGAVKGLYEALEDPSIPVGSIYNNNYAQKWSRIRENFNGNKAVFTMAPQPVKCAGAPQKIMHLSYDYWNRTKKIHPQISYYAAPPVVFTQPENAKVLKELADARNIKINLQHNLVEVRGKDRVAVFKDLTNQNNVEVDFDVLHVTPPLKPQDFIAKATSLIDPSGYVAVDINTLQSTKYSNVWALGDAACLPTAKTAAAVLAQTPVLVHNLLKVWKEDASREALAGYFGYTSCPLMVGGNKVLLAEFKYDAKLDETFPLLQKPKKPLGIFYQLKTKLFPFAYFKLMPRGLWYGRTGILPPHFKDVHGTPF